MTYSILFIFLALISNLSLTIQKVEESYSLNFNNANWSFDSTNRVYYQIGVVYITNPVNIEYQSLGIYVPSEYMICLENSGKYKCSVYPSGKRGSYSSSNAPIVIPVETPGYAAMKAPTSYSYQTISNFISRGIIYVFAGCRGRYEGSESYIAGAPWGVTDLKSAIRFLRYNSNSLPGDLSKIYTFGMSGGGAQSCLMGITGNSDLFNDYLKKNGAALTDSDGKELKDNIKGSQCWCPITNLDTADAAYEWNMGQYFTTKTRESGTFTKQVSNDLTNKFVEYVNDLKLKDPEGNELTLTDVNVGTYYNYLKKVIEESLNNFLSDTTFPYTPSGGDFPPGPPGPHQTRNLATTYQTAQEYIDSLNSDKQWITYNSETNKATITNVEDFVTHCKSAGKDVGAFDDFSKKQAENKLFGIDGVTYNKHFDEILANLLKDNEDTYKSLTNWDSSYPTEYTNDLDAVDSLGKTIKERVDMYNPMYYINEYYKGYGTSTVADHFRINTGIAQEDTGNVVEMNLYLALLNYKKDVKFTTVWDQKHVKAERTGTAERNFISWVNNIEGASDEDYDDNPQSFSNYINYNYLLFALLFLFI